LKNVLAGLHCRTKSSIIDTIFRQQIINGLTLGSIYALIALGYTLVYGIIQLINFAHGEIFTAGGYIGMIVLSSGTR
jgi:branched-subunit amino acid ABC-type transport system permease component